MFDQTAPLRRDALVKSADRSLDILELLAAHPEGVTFAEVVKELELPKSSAHALLHTLVARRYSELAPRGRRYRLGLKAAELSAAYSRGHTLLARARSAVRELAARCDETAHLAVLDGTDVLYLLAEESEHSMRLISPLGRRLPAHAAASGKVLLASLPDTEVARRYAAGGFDAARLPQITWRTVATLPDLLRELAEVRRFGHAHDVEGYAEGVHCVAAPVLDADGTVGAAISVSAPMARLDAERLPKLTALVREVAGGVSSVSEQRPPAGAPTARRTPVAWSMGSTLVPAYREMYRSVLAAASACAADLWWTDANEDELKQACDVRELLAQRPAVLVLHPVHAVHSDTLFQAAAAAKIPVLCFQRPVRSNAFALFVGGDTFQEGVIQIEFVAAHLHGHGNVVLIEGDPYNDNARNVAEGNRHALARFPGLRLLADEVSPHWSRATARRLAAELLDRYGPGPAAGNIGVHAIVCANDDMAGGVGEELAERGLTGQVCLVGGDGDREALECLQTGRQQATVFQDPAALAGQALQAAVALARGALDPESLPRRSLVWSPPARPVPALDVPYQLITRDNLGVLAGYWNEFAEDVGKERR
jgi:DNA-binding IclR family transcriptional regulator/DNA-binding LacI/PurR family transcriptional regulator